MEPTTEHLERRIAARPAAAAPHAVWLLDVDGVLNALGGRPGWPGRARAELRTFGGGVTELHYAPALMRVLTLLHHRRLVEFRWLTTWEEDAPGVFAPLVGLDVGARIAGRADDDEPWWKLRAFRSTCAGDAPFVVWTEDELPDHPEVAEAVTDAERAGRALVLAPSPATGLTPGDIETVLDALLLG